MKKPRTKLEQREYGLPDVDFPFVPREGHPDDVEFIRSEIDVILRGIDDMVCMHARKQQGRFRLSSEVAEDMAQWVRFQIAHRALPRFQRSRGAVLVTYLYSCAHNFSMTYSRDILRKQNKQRSLTSSDADFVHDKKISRPDDTDYELKVTRLADDIMNHPEKYLTKKQARVLRLYVANPGIKIKDLADMLGYAQTASLSMMLRRIRERIQEICIDEGPR